MSCDEHETLESKSKCRKIRKEATAGTKDKIMGARFQ